MFDNYTDAELLIYSIGSKIQSELLEEEANRNKKHKKRRKFGRRWANLKKDFKSGKDYLQYLDKQERENEQVANKPPKS